MEIDTPAESNGNTDGVKENQFHLYPVSVSASGEGLPYAPVNWPNPGDKWSWKVGRRIKHGYFRDRYLYPPIGLRKSARTRHAFASKLSVEQYIRETFPGADINAFFASFSWKIPANMSETEGCVEELTINTVLSEEEISKQLGSDSPQSGAVGCKAGNKTCSSLVEAKDSPSEAMAMACDICCSEPGFCRDCCCILCCKTINSAYGGYSFVKCEAKLGDGIICGHIAHIDCALRSYMAGTVGGSIGLDAEYYCRCCDRRTELVSHVIKLLRTCESIDSRDDIEKILNVGTLFLLQLKSGTCLEDIWKAADMFAVNSGGVSNHETLALEITNYQETPEFGTSPLQILSGNFDLHIESLKLEDEIDEVLRALRKAHESEYQIAEARLVAQKNYLLNLYQQLDKERSELSTYTLSYDKEALIDAVQNRVDQIKREILKLREMEQVAKGFSKLSKDVLKEHFGLEM
ncbi:CDPK adapter, putative [Actinidia rufa]|uniref:CDPK adapter, putative n=1 Tax=Actinidia rufa TaxID=165716 RepID=A0A7J0G9N6_9ERIC|nr:CDPK adapter, putative [Actinidia rufa]